MKLTFYIYVIIIANILAKAHVLYWTNAQQK